MPIIKCFVSDSLKTKFNADYIDSVSSTSDQKFSEHADYVFCYFPKYYVEDSKIEPEVFVTKKKLESDPVKFKKYFEALFKSKIAKRSSADSDLDEDSTPSPNRNVHEAWIESKLGKNWRELIIKFCERFLKINSIRLPGDNDRLIIALTKDDWMKVKARIKPEKVQRDLSKMYDENYDGSDLKLIELKRSK